MMNFHVLTLFPDMIVDGLNNSITGRAIDKNLISINAVQIRDYTNDKHNKVDDYIYGGGAGMLMQAQPVYDACEAVQNKIVSDGRKRSRVIFVTPRGYTFNQQMASKLSKEEDLIILCGHYEGIDERVLEEVVTDYISIGDFVLTGGELPAMVLIDCISRLVPDVLNNAESYVDESFSDGLLEYPQYSRPEEWHGKKVPSILLSGHHENVAKWRHEQALLQTRKFRPEMYDKYMEEHPVIVKKRKKKKTVANTDATC